MRRGPPDAVRGLRGAVAFLTRLPVHPPEWVRTLVPGASTTDPGDRAMEDWERFRGRPYTITLVGWLVGAIVRVAPTTVLIAGNHQYARETSTLEVARSPIKTG